MKILVNEDISLITEIFESKDWLRISTEFSSNSSNSLIGAIEVPTDKGDLSIQIEVLQDFPLDQIRFFCKDIHGYDHQMPNGEFCLLAAPSKILTDRLELELEKLFLWIQRYYVMGERDRRFEYYHFSRNNTSTLVFEEDSSKPSVKSKFGKFQYSSLTTVPAVSDDNFTWIATTLGGRSCRWSESFKKLLKERYTGIWILLDKHPVIQGRQAILSWQQLLRIISPEQSKFIYDERLRVSTSSGIKGGFYLAVGYNIPSDLDSEIHWENIFVSLSDFPFTPVKEQGQYFPEDLGYPVNWSYTSNASFERVFGRGQLPSSLCNSNILVIGAGAIGSNLIDLLVRGGIRNLEIYDGDTVEPGNISRGRFSFIETGRPKVESVYYQSIVLNPYLSLKVNLALKAIRKENSQYPSIKEKLCTYDYIFDCSTDKYLSIMLDEMQLPGKVINLSISNEANQMAVITGFGNIHTTKSNFYDRIGSGQQVEPFFVAQGCWHPTFKASMADISLLTSYALSIISLQIRNDLDIKSFSIDRSVSSSHSLSYSVQYHV